MAHFARFLGSFTNNHAEYTGIMHCLQHATQKDFPRICFRIDSMLVARHLQGDWACRAEQLVPMYEQCLGLLRQLRESPHTREVFVQHVYREYNSDADGLANYALDTYRVEEHSNGIVLDYAWSMSVEP